MDLRLYVGVTDGNWFDFLKLRPDLDEVNFWKPGGGTLQAPPGAPFLFKLKSPRNVIAGGGFVESSERLSLRDAWEFYGAKNGTDSFPKFAKLISNNRRAPVGPDTTIGCNILSEPFFLRPDEFVDVPADWASNIVAGRYYDLATSIGAQLWSDVSLRLAARAPRYSVFPGFGGKGTPAMYVPRRGQGTFRRLVLNAYGNRCAITGERTVPVLQASHIKPFSDVAQHDVRNGIALRADVHTLFDRGYVTVTPDSRFHVSPSIREEFENGRDYYALEGASIRLPADPNLQPSAEFLEWHSSEVFKS